MSRIVALAGACALAIALLPSAGILAQTRSISLQDADKTSAAMSKIPDPLSVTDAVTLGLKRNPQSRSADAGVAAALANYRSIASFPSPQLGVTHAQGTSTAPTLTGAEADTFIDVGETLDTSGQKRYQAAGAKAQFDSTRFTAYETKISLRQQIKDAYWSLAAAQQLTNYTLESLNEARKVNTLIKAQQQAGASPQVDVIRSGIDVANAEQAYIAAQGAEKTALAAFNTLMVRPPFAPVKLSDDIAKGIDATQAAAVLPELKALTARALSNRPLVKSAIRLVAVAEYSVRQTQASRYPDLAVDFERSLQQSSDTLMLNVHFPLIDLGTIHYSVRAAEETRKQAVLQKQAAEQQVELQVAQAYQDVQQAQAMLVSYLNDIFNPSVKLRDIAQLGYTQGATGILPVIDAESTLRNARTGYINSLLAARKAQDEMEAAMGTLAPADGGQQ